MKTVTTNGKRKRTNLIIIGITVVMLLGIFSLVPKDEGEYDEGLLQLRMERIAKGLISDKLKTPSTAEFGDIEYTHHGTDILMRGYVDAQNEFGAMLRSKWYVVINFTGTTKADLDSTNKFTIVTNELIEQ